MKVWIELPDLAAAEAVEKFLSERELTQRADQIAGEAVKLAEVAKKAKAAIPKHLSPSGEKLARKLGVPESEWAAIQNTGKAKHPTLSDIRAYNKSRGRPVEFDEDRAGAVEALKTLVSKRGVRAAREMLAHFSVVKVSDLKDDQLAEWVAKVEEELK